MPSLDKGGILDFHPQELSLAQSPKAQREDQLALG